MKQTLIKIADDHYVVVDDSEIKEDCYALHEGPLGEREIVTANGQCKLDKKITHSTQPLELLSENGLSGMGFSKVRPLNVFEVKELIGEVDVEKKAEESFPIIPGTHPNINWDRSNLQEGFITGYNQALEDNKEKKYTEEDIEKAIEFGHTSYTPFADVHYSNFIQSLQPKTEWEVTFDEQGKLRLI